MNKIYILLITLLWVIPFVYALLDILNYFPLAMTMKCLYFSFGILGYLITKKLIE